jgi:hypothetical protein
VLRPTTAGGPPLGSIALVHGLRSFFSRLVIRSSDVMRLLDTLLVFAITTILIVRTQLWLTNYPQLGGHGLHIAHLLWGGLLMLLALVVLLSSISHAARQVAAVVGGIGLGFFIDELGKFVTADNNYFFKPTAAIIYIFFVVLFLVTRHIGRGGRLSQREYLVNAIEALKAASLGALDDAGRTRALGYLDHADQSNPLVGELRPVLASAAVVPARGDPVGLWGRRVRAWFRRLVERPWFTKAAVAVFAVWAVASIVQIVALLVFATAGLSRAEVFRAGKRITNNPLGDDDLNLIQFADLTASIVAVCLVVAGLWLMLQGSRARGLAMLERALLVSIFFTQVFAFVYSQFFAVFGLFVDLLLFVAVRTMLTDELAKQRSRLDASGAVRAAAPAPNSGA